MFIHLIQNEQTSAVKSSTNVVKSPKLFTGKISVVSLSTKHLIVFALKLPT